MKQRKKRGRLSPAAENNLSDLFSGMTYAPAGTYGMGQAASLTVVRRSMLSSATNFNGSSHLVTVNFSYVMKNNETIIMLYRFLACTLACLVSVFSYAADPLMTYVGCTPEPGSEIENFDFKLTFDLSKVIETNGEAEYGIRVVGDPEWCTSLYEGEGDTKILLAKTLTSNINGTTADFEVGNNLHFSFPGIVPTPGKKYTLVIGNSFNACIKGTSKAVKNTVCDYTENQLVYVYTAKAGSENVLTMEECSILNGAKLDVLSSVTYKFNAPISIVGGVQASLSLNDNVVASSSSLEVNDDTNELTVKFDDVVLYNQNTYTVTLPEGIVCLKDNESSVNKAFSFSVSGSNFYAFGIKTSEPADNSTVLTNTVQITFDLPADYKLLTSMGDSSNFSASLYKEAVSEDNLVKDNVMGNLTSDGKGLEWSFGISPEPSTKYILYIPKFQFGAWKGKVNDYSNEEITLVYSTPSVSESGIPKVELQAPVLGIYNNKGDNVTLNNGDKIDEIATIDILQKDLRYSYNGEYLSAMITGSRSIEFYDITDGIPVLMTTATLSAKQYETTTYYYTVYRASVNSLFYEGHKYRLVIPAGTITCSKKLLQNYAGNEEVTVDFEGSTPTTVELISCSVADNAELSELPCVTWKFKGSFVRNPDLSANLVTPAGGGDDPTFVSVNNNGETVVQAFFYFDNGKPFSLRSGAKYTLILPEGIIYNAGDPSIKNEEMRINLTGIEKTPEVVEPEYVNVEIVTNDFMTTTQKAVKGKIFTYSMTFDSADWKLTSATQGDKNLAVTNGILVCPALSENTKIDLEVEYKGPWASDEDTTGIWQVPNSEIRIFRDGSFIVVEGVSPDNTINVYNVAGMLVNTTHASEGHDLVRLTVAPDQLYIVMVDGVAAKIKM